MMAFASRLVLAQRCEKEAEGPTLGEFDVAMDADCKPLLADSRGRRQCYPAADDSSILSFAQPQRWSNSSVTTNTTRGGCFSAPANIRHGSFNGSSAKTICPTS